MFRWPSLSPSRWRKVEVCCRRVRRSLELDEVFYQEPVGSEETNPRAVRKLIFDGCAVLEPESQK